MIDKNLIQRRPISIYFVLVYVLAWTGSFIAIGSRGLQDEVLRLENLWGIGAAMLLAPSLLGIIMTSLVDGRSGLRELFGRMKNWRVGAKWYAAPLIFPALILVCLLPLAAFVSPEFQPVFFPVGIMMGLFAGFLEEIGWMGFAFPRMRARFSALTASLILGLLHVLWHFGADYLGASGFRAEYFLPHFLAFCVSMIAMRIILCWVYVNTESLLLAQLMHAFSSGSLAILISMSFSPANDTIFYTVYSIALWGAAIVIIARYGKDLMAHSPSVENPLNLA